MDCSRRSTSTRSRSGSRSSYALRGWSITGGYYRNWFGNFLVTDNTLVTPADYDPYCVTAPTDSRLPNGGGYQVCGLYDIKPGKFGQVSSVVTRVMTLVRWPFCGVR